MPQAISIKFPDTADVIAEESARFQRLPAAARWQAIADMAEVGRKLVEASPNREALLRQQEEHERAWQRALKELFARHGV